MRLFVAVEIGADVQHALARVIGELTRRAERLAANARITWVAPDRLHVTVCFIGHVEPEVGVRIQSALEPPLHTPRFQAVVEGLGTFPPRRPPRVVWAGVTTGVEQMRSVQREVTARVQGTIVDPETREYRPHITLGRVKNPVGLRAAGLLHGLEPTRFGAVSVEAVTLFESRLSSKGPTYVPLARTPLDRTT